MGTNTCKKCTKLLPIDSFYTDKNGKTRNVCHNCRLEQTRASRELLKSKDKIILENKTCKLCNINKPTEQFNKCSTSIDGLDKLCRDCCKVKRKKRITNICDTNIQLLCKICNCYKESIEFRKAPKSLSGYFKTCNSCWKPREWNIDKQRESYKKYSKKYPDKMKNKWKKAALVHNRIIRDRLNHRISCALKSIKSNKSNKTTTYIGCPIEYLKKWLEYQFNNDIGWHNYGEWHIDHVMPCSEFNLHNIEEQYKCFNWTNLRPCLARENLEKNNKVIYELIESHKYKVSEFIKINPLPSLHGNIVDGTE